MRRVLGKHCHVVGARQLLLVYSRLLELDKKTFIGGENRTCDKIRRRPPARASGCAPSRGAVADATSPHGQDTAWGLRATALPPAADASPKETRSSEEPAQAPADC